MPAPELVEDPEPVWLGVPDGEAEPVPVTSCVGVEVAVLDCVSAWDGELLALEDCERDWLALDDAVTDAD